MTNKFTIDTLEKMFLYLGCANIDTSPMDGAIPVESMLGLQQSVITKFEMKKLSIQKFDWDIKTLYFSKNNLVLNTVQNVDWSRVSLAILNDIKKKQFAKDWSFKKKYDTLSYDGFVNVYHSEIDCNGKFIKFKVTNRDYARRGSVIVKNIFNPACFFAFINEHIVCCSSENEDVAKSLIDFYVPFCCGLAQSLDHHWLVRTKFESICPELTLITDPTGVKEFWKLRDIPEGKKRRDALLHWVNDHWRQSRNDPDVEHYVRKQLRGSTEAKKGGLSAIITPSKRDQLDIEIAKSNRIEMKRKRLDRRKRLLNKSRVAKASVE